MISKKYLFRTINIILTILVFVFAIFYGNSLIKSSSVSIGEINFFTLFNSMALFIAFYAILSYHWSLSLDLVNKNKKNSWLAFFASQPFKYLPTSIFVFSYRAKFSKDLGIDIKSSSKAQVIELFSMLTSSIILSIITFTWLFKGLFIAIIVTSVIIIAMHITKDIKIEIRKKVYLNKIKDIYKIVAVSLAAWIIAGMSFLILNRSLPDNNLGLLSAIQSNTISYTASIFAFFAPGGIGVREATLSFFNISASAIIAWRFLTLLLDLLLGFYCVLRIKKISSK